MSEPNQATEEQRDDHRPTLLLVDGYGLIFRAYYAIKNEISTSKGEVVNAVFGFASMLLDVLRRERPEHAIIALEGGPTFRDEEFAEYKANRGRHARRSAAAGRARAATDRRSQHPDRRAARLRSRRRHRQSLPRLRRPWRRAGDHRHRR